MVQRICWWGAFDADVDPGLGNPSYSLGDLDGQNSIILSAAQMAAHTHVATAVVTDPAILRRLMDMFPLMHGRHLFAGPGECSSKTNSSD